MSTPSDCALLDALRDSWRSRTSGGPVPNAEPQWRMGMIARRAAGVLIAVVLLLLLGPQRADAQLTPGSWTARGSTGLVLGGTYTVVADSVTGTVTGGWTLRDAQGRVTAQGAWSAVKAVRGWTGAWRSVVAGSARQWSGTFSADVPRQGAATLAELFTAAIADVMRGTWQTGSYSGTWAIRAAP